MAQASGKDEPSRWRPVVAGVFLCLPALFCLGRLVAHPAYFIDGEALITPTIGRELLHGHLLDAIHYQLIVYQGSLLVDGVLTALGFAVFGDHLFAWQWLSLAYVLGITACGALLLRRTGGATAALAFVLLLSAAPFLVKDGMLAAIGGHTTGLMYALLAVVLALPDSEGRHKHWQPLAAGLVLAFGAWYLRTVLLAGPAVVLALWPAGRQGLMRFALGTLLFPALLLVNVVALLIASAPDAVNGFVPLMRKVLWEVREFGAAERDLLAKVGEAFSLPYQSLLFAQPGSAVDSMVPERAGWAATARIWVSAWLLAPLLVLAAIPWKRGSDAERRRFASSAVVGTLVLSYALVYVFSPLRAEAILAEWAQVFPPAAPGVNAPRYLVPIYLLWTLLFAQGLGLLWQRPRLRPAVIVALALVAGSGLWQALGDLAQDRDPLSEVAEVEPYYYFKMFGPGRGPPQEVHERCETSDPVSRSNHLFTLGSFLSSTPEHLGREPQADKQAFDDLLDRRKISRADAQVLVHGMGRALGDQMFSSFQLSSAELLDQAWGAAEFLGPGLAEPYLFGVGEAMDHGRLHDQKDALVAMLCRPMSWGTYPLCSLAGQMLVDTGIQQAPSSPTALFAGTVVDFETQVAPLRTELLRGAAVELANSALALQLRDGDLSAWPAEDSQFFRSAWQSWRDGERWHEEAGAGFLLGRYH
jgi:hypothetical protein